MWTRFMDMHSGGGQKEDYSHIYIEAPIEEAKIIFYNRFGHNPERITCTCCGEDYSIHGDKDLKQLTAFHRDCDYNKKKNKYIEKPCKRYSMFKYVTLAKYKKQPDVLFISKKDIKPEERKGSIPRQGYVWVD
ncbi:MAG: hypothetical protein AABY32_01730 [Nanoarchaeota archaeon]